MIAFLILYVFIGACSTIGDVIADETEHSLMSRIAIFGFLWPVTLLSFLFAKVYR